MKAELLKKVPWRKVLKAVGATAIGVATVMKAAETSDEVAEGIAKFAPKVLKKSIGEES